MRKSTIILLFLLVFSIGLFIGVAYWRQVKTNDLNQTNQTLSEIDAEIINSQN